MPLKIPNNTRSFKTVNMTPVLRCTVCDYQMRQSILHVSYLWFGKCLRNVEPRDISDDMKSVSSTVLPPGKLHRPFGLHPIVFAVTPLSLETFFPAQQVVPVSANEERGHAPRSKVGRSFLKRRTD